MPPPVARPPSLQLPGARRLDRRHFVALFVGLAVAVTAAVTGLTWRESTHLRTSTRDQLSAIANVKVDQIEAWLWERRGDAVVASRGPVAALAFPVLTGTAGSAVPDELRTRLRVIKEAYQYQEIFLLDRDGNLAFSTIEGAPPASDVIPRALASDVVRQRDVLFSAPAQRTSGDGVTIVTMDVGAPLTDSDADAGRLAGVIVLRMTPLRFLEPILATWPAESHSGETTLAIVDDDSVAFLGHPRKRPDIGLALRYKRNGPPVDAQTCAARVRAAQPGALIAGCGLPEAGVPEETARQLSFVDYDGTPVLAVTLRVPRMPWLLTAKVDRHEVGAPFRTAVALAVSLVLALLGLMLLILNAWWRQLADRAQSDSQEQFKEMFLNAMQARLITDVNGDVRMANAAAAQLLGYDSVDDLVGRNTRREVFVNPVDRDQLWQQLQEKGRLSGHRTSVRKKNGEMIVVEGYLRLLRNADGTPAGAEAMIHDVGDRLRYESALKREQDALIQAREAAIEAGRLKSEFVANISHEIRTPVNAVVGLAHLALQTEPTEKQRDYLERIQGSARALLEVINDVLDFSKLEAGTLTLDRTPFRLEDVLARVGALLSLRAEEKGLELLFSSAADVPETLIGDPTRLGQVLLNLVGNGVKFTTQGEVVVKVTLADLKDGAATVRFSVSDTGIGIDEAQRARLFEPFHQGDGSTTRPYGGTGLGLVISRKLIQRMGGEITVESSPNQGSTFTFDVSLTVGQEAAPAPGGRTGRRAAGPHLRVLVVDDNATAREILRETLRSLQFEAVVTSDGPAALAALHQATQDGGPPYDLMLVDWRMPGMDGLETIRRTKAQLQHALVPTIIMVTAYSSESVTAQALALGVEAVMSKPVNRSQLFDTVMRVFGRRAQGSFGRSGRPPAVEAVGHPLQGTRVLLVEDIDINQEIARDILEAAGASVQIASNGLEATRMFAAATEPFAVVIMDVQMPIMDGYEATRIIRSLPGGTAVPIIALTAHAFESERHRCLEAGMNDHIAKPVDPDGLVAFIARWIAAGAAVARASAVPPSPPSGTANNGLVLPGLDGHLDVPAALRRLGNNRPLLRRLLRDFCRDFGQAADEIRQALARGDVTSAGRRVHALRGVAGNLAAGRVFASARVLDDELKRGVDGAPAAPLDLLATALRELTAAVATLGVGPASDAAAAGEPRPPAAPPVGDSPDLSGLIGELDELLRRRSLGAATCLDRLRPLCRADELQQPLAALADGIERLNFDASRANLRTLAEKAGVSWRASETV